MKRGLPLRQSRAAGWCRLIGGLALPVLALAVAGTRFGIVPGDALIGVVSVGFALAIAALALGVYALTDIWQTGAEGTQPALIGIAYAAPVLALLALVATAAIYYPLLTDVSTDPADPPALAALAPETLNLSPEERIARQRSAYPDIEPHTYPFPIDDVYAAATKLMEDRGWTIAGEEQPAAEQLPAATTTAPAAQAETDEVLRQKTVMMQSRREVVAAPGIAAELPPGVEAAPEADEPEAAATDVKTLEAVARTTIFGFSDDVALRFRSTPDGTLVDMRSRSRSGRHDLGQNARRIKRFLADLQLALQPVDESGTPIAAVPLGAATGE